MLAIVSSGEEQLDWNRRGPGRRISTLSRRSPHARPRSPAPARRGPGGRGRNPGLSELLFNSVRTELPAPCGSRAKGKSMGAQRREAKKRKRLIVRLKRAYDPPTPNDGARVLVDRLWPRGMTKEKLKIDAWMGDLAPSDVLRKWFGHDPAKWEEFRRRYMDDLAGN